MHGPGELAERTKAHDWKSCVGQLTVGSNPTLSANRARRGARTGTTDAVRPLPVPAPAEPAARMALALAEARLALDHDDVPVGAVVVVDGHVVAARHNERERTGDPTAHAEVLALRDAAAQLGRWRLDDALLVVTLEPCPMCAGAAWASRLGRVEFGAYDLKAGAMGSLYHVGADARLNHEVEVRGGIAADACAALLSDFFAGRRA